MTTSMQPFPAKRRLSDLLGQLETGLVERRRQVRLALLVALAGEHTLLIGPPGTAKSELARRLHLAFADARYFERLLTRFSVPEELFGPLSISALEQDRYERQTAGYLPQASIAFIDEVFKANSAILNALLTLLNERKFDNGAGRVACPLISAIGATNEVPAGEVAEAFFDRFLVRLPVGPVSADGFRALLALDDRCGPHVAGALAAAERDAIAAALPARCGSRRRCRPCCRSCAQHLEGGAGLRFGSALGEDRVAAEDRGGQRRTRTSSPCGICGCCPGARRTTSRARRRSTTGCRRGSACARPLAAAADARGGGVRGAGRRSSERPTISTTMPRVGCGSVADLDGTRARRQGRSAGCAHALHAPPPVRRDAHRRQRCARSTT